MANTDKDLALFQELAKALFSLEDSEPVAPRIEPEEAKKHIDIRLENAPQSEEQLKKVLLDLIRYSPKSGSRLFVNQLFGGRMSKAVLGDLLAVLLNNSMYTYKAAGPQILVEQEVIRQSADLAGFPAQSDGVFAPGGSMSNLMALITARDARCPEFVRSGSDRELIAYTSEESHYSIPKNMGFAGLGRDRLRFIPADETGSMRVDLLARAIEKDRAAGRTPFFVNATAGTTVLGAFDPLSEIAEVCQKYDLFLHVDGAYCGSVMFSDRYKSLIKGMEQADSFSFNAHKMLGTPLTCSLLLVRDGEKMRNAFAYNADYLFQSDHDELNPGMRSMQCGRRNDALKFWVLWKSLGTKGLGEMVDRQFELAAYARGYVRKHPDYTLYGEGDSISVCFNYKNADPVKLAYEMYEEGVLTVSHGQFKENQFVRLVTINSLLTEEVIDEFFEKLERYAEKNKTAPFIG